MSKRPEKSGADAAREGRVSAENRPAPTGGGPRVPWVRTRSFDLRFVLKMALWVALFYLIATRPFMAKDWLPRYLKANASASAVLLNWMGQDVSQSGTTVRSNKKPFSIEIARGCDALDPSILFCAAVLASPVRLLSRLAAVVVGTLLLMVLNFVRVVSLFLIGIYWRNAFDVMHLEVWQVVFIFLAMVFFIVWATRMTRKPAVQPHVAG